LRAIHISTGWPSAPARLVSAASFAKISESSFQVVSFR
jgi:hypothetical protein